MLKNHLLRLLKKVQMQGERVERNAADGPFSAT
jgi:hypothetical protein